MFTSILQEHVKFRCYCMSHCLFSPTRDKVKQCGCCWSAFYTHLCLHRSCFLLFLKTGTTFSSFQSTGISLQIPKITQKSREAFNDIKKIFEDSLMNSMILNRFKGIQLEQQIPHNFRVNWEYVITQSQSSISEYWDPLGPSSVLKTDEKKALNISGLSPSLFVM